MRQQDIAYELAKKAHEGQTRRDGITPYFDHVQDVARIAQMRGGNDDVIAAAFLHDIFEEDETLGTTFLTDNGINEDVATAVCFLTHRKKGNGKQSYEDYIKDILYNHIARNVKIADNLSNLSDAPTDKQILKYAKSLQILMTN